MIIFGSSNMKEKTLWRDFDKLIENSFKDFNRDIKNQNRYDDLNSEDFVIRQYSEPINIDSFSWENVLIDSSKKLVDFGVKLISENSNLFPSLLKLALSQKKQLSQRASRVLYYSIELNISKYDEFLDEILNSLKYVQDESLIFNLLHVFTISKLPENDNLKFLMNYCFKALNNNDNKIASKAYAMDILYRISKIEPEIKYTITSSKFVILAKS